MEKRIKSTTSSYTLLLKSVLCSGNIFFFSPPQREATSELFWIKLCKQMDRWKSVTRLTGTPLHFCVSRSWSWMLPSRLLTQRRQCRAARWGHAFWCGWSFAYVNYVQAIIYNELPIFFLTGIFLKMRMYIEVLVFRVTWYIHHVKSNYINNTTIL